MARWWFRLHQWTALIAGAFFVVLALTGSILAFEKPLDHLAHAKLAYVPAAANDLPIAQIVASVKAHYPDDDVVSIAMEPSPRLAWQVATLAGIVYVNPHTGEVTGLRERGQTLLGRVGDLHTHLATAYIGKSLVRWTDVAALLLLTSGFVLWWPRRRIRLPKLDGSRRAWSEWHIALGMGSVLFLWTAAFTGAIISFEAPVRAWLLRADNGHRSEVHAEQFHAAARHQGAILTADEALQDAAALVPRSFPSRIQMPAYGGTYRIAMVQHHVFGPDQETDVTLDPSSGTAEISSDQDASEADRFFRLNESVHTGSIFGLPGRAVLSVAGVLVLPQALSGLLMWMKRRTQRTHVQAAKEVVL